MAHPFSALSGQRVSPPWMCMAQHSLQGYKNSLPSQAAPGLGWAVLKEEKLWQYLPRESGKAQQAIHSKEWKHSKNYRSSGGVLIVFQY